MDRNLTTGGLLIAGVLLSLLAGCGGTPEAKQKKTDFFTSGSPEADQRASQRMAKAEQLSGEGEGTGEKGTKKAEPAKGGTETKDDPTNSNTNTAARSEGKLALYDRLGGEVGISNIVADFTFRAMDDPRVNWGRKGVSHHKFRFHHNQSSTWTNSPQNVEILRNHFVQFIALATGGPAQYDGKEIKNTHAGMHISNPEFDAAVGDLKATLDKLQIPNKEQKELLAIVESTRPQIVEER
jgi:hemoglobin